MEIRQVMNRNAIRIHVGATMMEAADIVSQTQTSDLMVVDDDNTFVGVLSEGDLIRAILPRFDEIMQSGGGLSEAFELFIENGHEKAAETIDGLIIRDPITFAPNTHVLKAASTMIAKQIRRLPVVDGGKLVGTVARADVCKSVLRPV
jgi:CBS domain-containing protein